MLSAVRSGTRGSLAVAACGSAGLAVVLAGTTVVLLAYGLVPVASLVAGLESDALTAVLVAGGALGAAAVAVGSAIVGRVPTVAARGQVTAGIALGAQAVLLAAGLLWWTSGDVRPFAENFLDFDAVTPELGAFADGAVNTIRLAFTAELAGLAIGLGVALLAVSRHATIRAPARVFVNGIRATPLLWQLSFVYFGVALGLQLEISTYTAAVIALSVNAGAYLAEVFRAGIQSIERGQLDAALGLGMRRRQAMRVVVLPQAVVRVIPPLMNDFVILVKDTSLVLFLGLALDERELMSVGQEGYSDSFNATFFVFTALGYLAICLPLMAIVNRAERRFRSGLVGVTGA